MDVVGIDWAWDFHICYSIEKNKIYRIKDNEAGYRELLNEVSKEAVFVIEESFNRISDFLLSEGREVYLLPPKRSKEARGYHSNGIKTDSLDARSIALTYSEHPEYCIRARNNEEGRSFREQLRVYRYYKDEASRLKNKLHNELHDHFPEFVEVMGNWKKNKGKILLLSITDELKSLSIEEIHNYFKENQIAFTNSLRKKAKELKKREWHITKYTLMMVANAARHLLEVERGKQEMKNEMERNLKESKYRVILSLPGVGVVTGVALVAAFLNHEFGNYRNFQKYCGTVPIIIQSGNFRKCVMRKHCDRNLKGTLHMMALSAVNKGSWMKGYYARKIKEGKSFGHALRALANTLVKIAFAMLKSLKPYDEELFLSSRGNKSPQSNYTTKTSTLETEKKTNEKLSLPVSVAQTNCHLGTDSGRLSP